MSVFTNDPSDLGQRFEEKIIGICDEFFYFELNAAGEQQQEKRK